MRQNQQIGRKAEFSINGLSSVLHSGWWAIITLTTVDYGDVYPITVGGKIFTTFIVLIGVGIVSIPSGFVARTKSYSWE